MAVRLQFLLVLVVMHVWFVPHVLPASLPIVDPGNSDIRFNCVAEENHMFDVFTQVFS